MLQPEKLTIKPFRLPLMISTYPQRFVNIVMIEITARDENYCIISLCCEADMIRRMLGVSINRGLNSIPLMNLESLSSGTYCLEVKNTDGFLLYSTELTK